MAEGNYCEIIQQVCAWKGRTCLNPNGAKGNCPLLKEAEYRKRKQEETVTA